MSDVVVAAAATGSDFFKAIFILELSGGRDLQLRAKSRNEMRELLGKLHLHCFGPSGVAKEAAPQMSRTVLMAGWLFQKARTGARERAAGFLGLGGTLIPKAGEGNKAMVIDGDQWHVRWFVLDANVGTNSSNARLRSHESEVVALSSPGVEFPLAGFSQVQLQTRNAGHEIVHANFALKTKGSVLEFAARSEAEASEWVVALERVLLISSSAYLTGSGGDVIKV